MDIASLGFRIDTSDVKKAETELAGLSSAGAKTEATAKGVGDAWSSAGRKVGASAAPIASAGAAFKQGNDAIKAQQAELTKLLGKIDPVVAALGRLDDQEQQLRKFKGAGLVDTETFREYSAKIDQARKSLSDVDGTIRRTGSTSKQTAAALRQLPAQFSDIFISLQAGQSPLSVFLQQGSQIKDAFGGVGPALRETAKYAAGLVNPYTLAAGAALALAVAWKQGSDESVAFNKAIILSGNYAGTSAEQLANAAAAMDQVAGTQRQAAAALAEVAGSAQFTADQVQGVATAAVAMEQATGKAVSETVSEFKKLADEPAAASAKLNEQYNYLTAAIYEQIAALEAQGDAAGAAQLAIESFGSAMQQRATEIEGSLGLIERAWKGIKSGAAEAWDEMLGVGRPATLEDQLAKLNTTGVDSGAVAAQGAVLGPLGAIKELYDQIAPQVQAATDDGAKQVEQEKIRLQLLINQRDTEAAYQGQRARAEQEAIAAQRDIDAREKQFLTNAQKRTKEVKEYRAELEKIRQANPFDERLDKARVASNIANIEAKYKDPKAAKTPTARDDAATKLLITLREQQSALDAQLGTETRLTAEQKKRAEFESLIADLKTKEILTADQKSLLANQDAIRAQLDKNVAIAEEVRLQKDSIKLQERSAQLQQSIQSSSENRSEQYSRRLDAFGQGSQAQEQAAAAADIFKEFRRYQDQLNKNTPKDLLGSAQYLDARKQIGEGLREALAQHDAYYSELKAKQADWKNGASEAFSNYADEARNVADQTSNLIGGTMEALTDGIGESFADALLHGEDLRESFTNLADTILTEVVGALAEMGARFAINQALEIAGITAVTAAETAATTTETAAELASTATVTTAKTAAAATVAGAEIAAIGATTAASAAATATTTATQAAAAASTTAAWTPAAIVSSIGSFGTAAAIGLAAVVAALAFSGGFRKGGYTGNGGVGEVAGVVHGKEYVFDAESTARIGVANLEAMRAGRDIARSSVGGSGGSATPQAGGSQSVTLHQTNNFRQADNRTANQVASATAQKQRQAQARLG